MRSYRCDERQFHDSPLKRLGFYASDFRWDHIPYANCSGKMKRPLHLCDTYVLGIVHGFESGPVGPGEDLNNVIYKYVEGRHLFNNTSSLNGWPSKGSH